MACLAIRLVCGHFHVITLNAKSEGSFRGLVFADNQVEQVTLSHCFFLRIEVCAQLHNLQRNTLILFYIP